MNHTKTKRNYAQWSLAERQQIFEYIALCGGSPNWQDVSDFVRTKTKRECYDFYQQNKDSQGLQTVRHKWTQGEEQVIIDCAEKAGFSVDAVKQQLPHLTFHEIKDRYYNLIKRGRIAGQKQEADSNCQIAELVYVLRQFCLNESVK